MCRVDSYKAMYKSINGTYSLQTLDGTYRTNREEREIYTIEANAVNALINHIEDSIKELEVQLKTSKEVLHSFKQKYNL